MKSSFNRKLFLFYKWNGKCELFYEEKKTTTKKKCLINKQKILILYLILSTLLVLIAFFVCLCVYKCNIQQITNKKKK